MKEITINGKKFYYYNVDDNKINYTQRNNKFFWGEKNNNSVIKYSTTCNVTSICMALDYAGYKFPSGKYEQPEDNLANHIINSELVDKEYARRYPAMYKAFKNDEAGCYTPNEIHKLLEIGTNEWIGADVDSFSDCSSVEDIISDIVERQLPVVLSGTFPVVNSNGKKTVLNHIVCLVGVAFENKKNTTNPSYFVIDDPWGYTHNYYSGKNGNDVFLSKEQFYSYLKPVNNKKIKFAHRFKKPVAIV